MEQIRQTIQEFYQVEIAEEFPWRGLELDEERKIEIEPHDILIKSLDGEHYNRINYSGAVNILIPDTKVVKRKVRLEIDESTYEKGFTCNN